MPAFHKYNDQYYFIDTNKYFHQHSLAEVGDSLKKLEQLAEEAGDPEFAGSLKLHAIIKAFRERKISNDTIENDLLMLNAHARDNGLHYLEADVLQMLGDFYGENNEKQSTAIEFYVSAYAIYKNFSSAQFPPKQSYIYTLAGMYYKYEDYNNAIKYMQEAIHSPNSVNKNIFCSMYNTVGMAYRQQGKYDSAIVYFKRSYEAAVRLENTAWQGISQGNIGITYFRQKKYAEAIPLLKIDIESGLNTNNIKNSIGSMAILATIYNEQHEYDKAEELLLKGLRLGQSKQFWPSYQLAEQLFTQLYKLYAARGNFKLAYLYADSAIMAKDSAINRNNAVVLAKASEKQNFIQQKLDEEKFQNQAKLNELAISKKRIEITFAIIGLGILLAVIVFITRERKRSEILLLNILPERIADRLKKKEHPIADYFDHASIIFIDMAGFTVFADGRDPKEIVNILNHVFTSFDNIAERHGLEKIKTIGDCYMAVSGLPDPHPNHAEAATQMALDIRAEMKGYEASDGTPIEFRIGLDCGPVVAGVIGRRKFIYDLWGDTVNTASRMETTGVAGEIHCTDRFKKIIEHKHRFRARGQTEIKGKGAMDTWLIVE
jgi:class 3 adenylate cyclase